MPKLNRTGSVPRPKTNSNFPPSAGLPVPIAITYMACSGPQTISRPFSRPMMNGLLRFLYWVPTKRARNRGVLN